MTIFFLFLGFEVGNEHDDLLKEFAPKIAAMQEFTDDSLTDRLSTIPEMPSHATSVEEFHKVLEQSTRSSSPSKSSSLITSPIQVPVKPDKEVSEEPREIPSLMENQRQPDMIIQPTIDDAFKELNISELSEGPLEHESTMTSFTGTQEDFGITPKVAKPLVKNSGSEREIQKTMLELLNQLDGFDSRGDDNGGVSPGTITTTEAGETIPGISEVANLLQLFNFVKLSLIFVSEI